MLPGSAGGEQAPVSQPNAATQLLSWPFDAPAPSLEPTPAVLLGLSLPELPGFDMPDFPPMPDAPDGPSLDDLIGDLTDTIDSLTDSVFGGGTAGSSPVPPVDGPAVTLPETGPKPEAVPATPRDDTVRAPAGKPLSGVTWSGGVHRLSVLAATSGGTSGGVGRTAAEHVHKSTVPSQPVKAPAAPAPVGGGSSASTAHDQTSGARGTQGVPSAHPPLEPSSAGFTTRSRAADASGRVAGLPATSPD